MSSTFKPVIIKMIIFILMLMNLTDTWPQSIIPSLTDLIQKKCIEVISSQEPKLKNIHSYLQSIPPTLLPSFIYKCLEDKNMPSTHKVKIAEIINRYDMNIGAEDKEILAFLIGIKGELTVDAVACAIRQENIDVLIYLIEEKKISINQMTPVGKYPLHYAVEQDNSEIVTYLLEQGSDVNCLDNERYTPLHLVKSKNIAQILCNYKANVHAGAGKIQYTPIDTAWLACNKEVELFLRGIRQEEEDARWR